MHAVASAKSSRCSAARYSSSFFRCEVSTGEPFFDAALQGGSELLTGKAPTARLRLCKEPVDFGRRGRRSVGRSGAGGGPPGFQAISGVLIHGHFRYFQYGRASNAVGMLGI